jgi:predicted metal-dependent phosphoesterase TrpH
MANAPKIDLHVHTNHSDGTWAVEEMIEYAVTSGLTHIAVTDHDTVSGVAPATVAARGRLDIIPAVEINTVAVDSSSQVQDVHILGYFIDPQNAHLQAALIEQQRLRQEHVHSVLQGLNTAGINLNLDDIKVFSQNSPIGKAHITKALVAIGAAQDIIEAYEKYTSKNSPFFVQRQSISPEKAIAAICAAGGIASLAHSGKRADVFEFLQILVMSGLGAVEVFHRMHSLKQQKELENFARKNSLFITGGSDCHGPYEEFLPTIGSITLPEEALKAMQDSRENTRTHSSTFAGG